MARHIVDGTGIYPPPNLPPPLRRGHRRDRVAHEARRGQRADARGITRRHEFDEIETHDAAPRGETGEQLEHLPVEQASGDGRGHRGEDGRVHAVAVERLEDVAVLDQGHVSTFKVSPQNAGLSEARPKDLTGGDAAENAAHIRAVLGGNQGPLRDIVLFNAAAALLVAGKAKTLREGVALAAESIDSGKAKGVLEALVKLSHDRV